MLAQLLLDGGIYLWSKRLLDDAETLLDRSQGLCEMRGEDKVLLSEIYSLRAAVLADSGNLDEALKYFERAMSVIKSHLMAARGNEGAYDQIYLANAYNNLGAMYAQLGNYDKAKTQIEVSLFLKKKWQDRNVPMSHLLCLSYQNLGNIHAQLGDFAEAARYFDKALETGTVESSTLRIALTYHNYGALNLARSNLAEARRLLEEAYQLRVEALGDCQDTAATLHLLACCHHQSGDKASSEAAR
jgi:tetratricopeptide (TPR) repeat protein